MLDRFPGQMWQRDIGSMLQNAVRIRIAGQAVRVHQPTEQLVVAVRRETVVLVKISRNRLGIQLIEP